MTSQTNLRVPSLVLLRGGGDLASGVALRLHRSGMRLLITELPAPLAVRRLVSFSEAAYEGRVVVEGVTARRVTGKEEVHAVIDQGEIPVLVDPEVSVLHNQQFDIAVLIDARMTKRPPETGMEAAPLVIGLGPGFIAGRDCHAVIETNRGHDLGRVIWDGPAESNSGIPGKVNEKHHDRVLRAPVDGRLRTRVEIGSLVKGGDVIASVARFPVVAPFDGVLRGLLRQDYPVSQGMKIGDLDPRQEPRYAVTVSEKSMAIAGGVLEALLTKPAVREKLWS